VLIKNEFEDEAKDYSYLLVAKTNDQGAVVINEKGEKRDVSRTFILKHWGDKVSWVYPITNRVRLLSKGKNSPEVLQIQKILNKIGYIVNPTGIYDDSTFDSIMKFQKDFGLSADGIAGPRTMALLFQMVGWDELY
jgi:murein L,D-transpeptidase YcbB/YkuD